MLLQAVDQEQGDSNGQESKGECWNPGATTAAGPLTHSQQESHSLLSRWCQTYEEF